ncbi:hypothetical protein VXC91_41330 [Streptomyces chiangmaiensis]|uniref:Uncharacterized protein n=1 Tax=Streptomyces chiangmaiensis TaxID=766497 RepID=A0ABU7FX71_9ACTN|nr:hypothetical protein [Streptomyces chiangmaiensis]
MLVARAATALTQPAADDLRGRITTPTGIPRRPGGPRAAAARPPIHRGLRRQPLTAHE